MRRAASAFLPLTAAFAPTAQLKRKMSAMAVTVGTHSGTFQADEALGV